MTMTFIRNTSVQIKKYLLFNIYSHGVHIYLFELTVFNFINYAYKLYLTNCNICYTFKL